eukprot:GEMP01035257.1.p1 GENE.GEMP01035257.1~~GEMP01035257.1.p1  ORF type:complete len:193 (-),score=44.77 GEMP01035257.1:1337-1915(-)
MKRFSMEEFPDNELRGESWSERWVKKKRMQPRTSRAMSLSSINEYEVMPVRDEEFPKYIPRKARKSVDFPIRHEDEEPSSPSSLSSFTIGIYNASTLSSFSTRDALSDHQRMVEERSSASGSCLTLQDCSPSSATHAVLSPNYTDCVAVDEALRRNPHYEYGQTELCLPSLQISQEELGNETDAADDAWVAR